MNRENKIANLLKALIKVSDEIKTSTDKNRYLKLTNKFLSIEKEMQVQSSYLVNESEKAV